MSGDGGANYKLTIACRPIPNDHLGFMRALDDLLMGARMDVLQAHLEDFCPDQVEQFSMDSDDGNPESLMSGLTGLVEAWSWMKAEKTLPDWLMPEHVEQANLVVERFARMLGKT